MSAPSKSTNGHSPHLRYIDLAFDNKSLEESARALVYELQPAWQTTPGEVAIKKFTDGITNTLLQITKVVLGKSQIDIEQDSILLRAYGNHTEILIDRDREARSHALCAERRLAPPLLARFRNGLLYRYITGQVCTPQDLVSEPVWRAVARRLGEWHATLPVSAVVEQSKDHANGVNGHETNGATPSKPGLATRRPVPNVWSVMQRWVDACPRETSKQQARRELLQQELDRSFSDLDTNHGPGEAGLVFGHCDLLSANVIMLPKDCSKPDDMLEISLIDYEYATPCPAAFDIANHFAEWGGYDCDYNMLPTKSVRRQFLSDYMESYKAHSDTPVPDDMLDILYNQVDRFRGMPGLFWGIWALIQATISEIDFDYASYAEVRLGEYFAWRAEEDGRRIEDKLQIPLRERRWAED